MGLVAAVSEMLLQSHEPGILRVLPAMSSELYPSGGYCNSIRPTKIVHILKDPKRFICRVGVVSGMRCRGGYSVSLHWIDNSILGLRLDFEDWHPWLRGQHEDSPGFYSMLNHSSTSDNKASIKVITPQKMAQVPANDQVACASIQNDSWDDHKGYSMMVLNIFRFPCSLSLCSINKEGKCFVNKLDVYSVNDVLGRHFQ